LSSTETVDPVPPAEPRRLQVVSDLLARAWWSWPLAAFAVVAATGQYVGSNAAAVTTGLIVAVAGALGTRLMPTRAALVAVFVVAVGAYALVLARSNGGPAVASSVPATDIETIARQGNTLPLDLRNTTLSGARLVGVDLTGRNMAGVEAQGTNLAGANLTGANLAGADLRGANLRGAKFTNTCMRGADLTGAQLDGADFTGAEVATITGIAHPPTNVIGWAPATGNRCH
jgi:hypothetical protein